MSVEDQNALIQITQGCTRLQVALMRIRRLDREHAQTDEEQAICILLEEYFANFSLQVLCLYRSAGYLCIFCDRRGSVCFEEIINKMLPVMEEENGICFAVGLGKRYPQEQMAVSLNEAKIALEAAGSNEVVVFHEALCQNSPTELFPQKTEKQLEALIQTGDQQQVMRIIEMLHSQCQSLAPREEELVCSGLILTLNRIFAGGKFSACLCREFSEISTVLGTPHVWDTIQCIAGRMSQENARMREETDSDAINRIQEMIQRQYADDQLSVSALASQLGITDKYLSRYYKEATGQNLSDAIEAVRMNQAAALLRDGMSVSVVFHQVGYTNDRSFRRAFKRYFGFSPSNLSQ